MNIFLILGTGSFLKQDVKVFIFKREKTQYFKCGSLKFKNLRLLKDILKSKKKNQAIICITHVT